MLAVSNVAILDAVDQYVIRNQVVSIVEAIGCFCSCKNSKNSKCSVSKLLTQKARMSPHLHSSTYYNPLQSIENQYYSIQSTKISLYISSPVYRLLYCYLYIYIYIYSNYLSRIKGKGCDEQDM